MKDCDLFNDNLCFDDPDYTDLEHDLISDVIESLKGFKVDYCFKDSDKQKIEMKAKECKITACYRRIVDRYGNLDYYEIIPLEMFKKKNGKNIKMVEGFYPSNSVPNDIKCVAHCNRTIKTVKDYNKPMSLFIIDEDSRTVETIVNEQLKDAIVSREINYRNSGKALKGI